jgi:hypothetical protein
MGRAALWRATLVLSVTVCGVFGADQPGSQEAAAALQPALMSARTGPCTEDDHCGDHGVCLIDEGSCFCDLGFSGRTCADPSVKDTVHGSSDKGYWTNLTLGNVRTGGGGGGGGGGGSPNVGLLGGPTATANNWFNPFAASAGAYNPFAAAAAAAKAASRSVINPFAAPPHGAVSFLGSPTRTVGASPHTLQDPALR